MVSTALIAKKELHEVGIEASVIDPITIKPLDDELIESCARKTKRIVTVENHNVIGGLGSAVAEVLSERYPVRIERVGVQDRFGQVGNEDFLRKQYHLTVEEIVKNVKKIMQQS